MELETKKDGLKFTSRALAGCAADLAAVSREYEDRQQLLAGQVLAIAATFSAVWEEVAALLAELDVLVGFADLAVSAPKPYTRPRMAAADGELLLALQVLAGPSCAKLLGNGAGNRLCLHGARHPCVEAQDGVDFIANDCSLEVQSGDCRRRSALPTCPNP